MAKISDLNNRLTKLPQPQSPAKAGFMQTIAGTSGAPSGWLLCDGSVVNQADFPDLYARIGTTFNTGSEGVGTFRLPNGGPEIKTKWTSWTPEFENDPGTPTWHYMYWRRNGQNLEVYGKVTFSVSSYDYAFSGPKIEGNLQAVFANVDQDAVLGYTCLQDTASTDRRLQPVVYLNNAATGNVDGFRFRTPNTIGASIYTFFASVPVSVWLNDNQYIIKAYDDSINSYSVGITEATTSSAGSIQLSQSFAANASDYGLYKIPSNTYYQGRNPDAAFINGYYTISGTTITILEAGFYLVSFHMNNNSGPSGNCAVFINPGASPGTTGITSFGAYTNGAGTVGVVDGVFGYFFNANDVVELRAGRAGGSGSSFWVDNNITVSRIF